MFGLCLTYIIISLLEKGGYVMYPILFLFSAAVFLFIERYLYIRKTTKIDENFLHNINELLLAGNIQAAVTYCKNSKFPIANMLERGLGRLGSPIREIESAIENKAKLEIYNMEKNLGIFSSIARIAPMFGFLGTVKGMIVSTRIAIVRLMLVEYGDDYVYSESLVACV